MPAKQQANNGSPLSAFNALGSYADRIKDADGNLIKPAPSSPPALANGNANGNGNEQQHQPSQGETQTTMPHTKSRDHKPSAALKPSPAPIAEEDGAWETVQSTRQRTRQEDKEKHGSNSKNWRDRSHRDAQGQKERSQDDSEKKTGGNKNHSHSHKKGANSHAPSTTSAAAAEKPARPASAVYTAVPAKPAWGALAHPAPATTAAAVPSAGPVPNAKENGPQDLTVPSSPSLNGTTVTANSVSVPASVGSPNLSSETASTSTASASVLSKAVDKLEEEGSWRARPNSTAIAEDVATPPSAPQPAAPRQAAPPPAVNAWELRKKKLTPAVSATASASTSSATSKSAPSTGQPAQNGAQSNHKTLPNGHNKEVGNKLTPKKKSVARSSGPTVAPPPIHDTNLWPDVAQAVEVAKAAEGKKEKTKERRTSESAAVVEEPAGTGKKAKWTPIPASEILANADLSSEQNRRQSRLEASAKKRLAASKGEGESSSAASAGSKAAKPRKSAAHPADPKKAPARAGQNGTTSELKAPLVSSQQGGPGEVTVNGEADKLAADQVGAAETVNGDGPTPLSRQTSRQSKLGSPAKPEHQLPAPASNDAVHPRSASGPLQSRPMVGSNTAPLPQNAFNPTSGSNLPRPPRGRDARGSFNGRGRGGFRSNSAMPHKAPVFGSPPPAASGLPADGSGSAFSRTFAGFQPFYPVSGYAQQGIYDPVQAQYGAVYRGGLPPPPMPQTVVPNLDATRFYVLGQIEYYFSMQNLAMDFFLRQQMDSEGWIDVSMIASFNRVKSLTPDASIVRECMVLSAFLEVREDKVRLAGPDAQRWVLPDAKPSKFGPDPLTSPSQATEESRDLSLGIPASVEQSLTSGEDGQSAAQQAPRSLVAADVENALMKSSNTTNAAVAAAPESSATSVVNGEGTEKTEEAIAPAASTSGDVEGKDDGEDADNAEA